MDLLTFLTAFKYPALFLAAFFEGPVSMIAAGFLLRMGALTMIATYLSLLFGDLAGDLMWYAFGYYGAHRFIKRFGKFFGITEKSSQRVITLYRKHESKIMFISKITMGFGLAVGLLFAAGMSRVPLRKFILMNFLGGLLWTAFVMMIGYVFGNIYLQVSEGLQAGTIVVFVVIILLLLHAFRRTMKKHVLRDTL